MTSGMHAILAFSRMCETLDVYGGGLYKLNPVVTHSWKAPGFQPLSLIK
jgi:hypothetical protein